MIPRIFVAGHNGMVGRAIVRQLKTQGICEIVTRDRADLDLLDQSDTENFFQREAIDAVYLAAAKVGGIQANNNFPAEFIYENLMIEANIIQGAHRANVQKLLFLGSGCIYPKLASQPMQEGALLTGLLEATNEPYAIAKIAGIKMCESYNRQYGRDYRSVMPTNLYGAYDNFHPENSHVIPALLRRFHQAVAQNATEITIWGTGRPRREFLHVDDMAAASVFVMNLSSKVYAAQADPMLSHINVGTGVDCTICDLAETIAAVTGFTGKLVFDHTQPDGVARRLLDTSKLNAFGWLPAISLREGLQSSYNWFVDNQDKFRS
jgi:GDP-L-fucose synthase